MTRSTTAAAARSNAEEAIELPSGFLLERDKSLCHLTEHLIHIYQEQRDSSFNDTDVFFLIPGYSKLGAHRSILAAVSPYFSHILKDVPPLNTINGDIIISLQGYKGNIVEKLLEFLYTGKTTLFQDEEVPFTNLLSDWEIGDSSGSVEYLSGHQSPIQEEDEGEDNGSPFIQAEAELHEEPDVEAHPSDSPGTSTNSKRKRGSNNAEKAGNKKAKATESLECETCGQVLKTKTGYRLHLLVHQGSKTYVCGVCGKSFRQGSQLKTHTRTHTGEKPFACDQCDRSFSHASTLSEHKNLHNSVKPFECAVCHLSFAQKKALRAHRCHRPEALLDPVDGELTATKNESFICPFCHRSFTTRRGLSIHKMHAHADTSSEPLLQCDHCSTTFSTEQAYEEHLATTHA